MSTLFVGSGICTFLQATFGNRLPILQGGTFSFLTPTFALMATAPFICDNKKLVQCTSSNVTSSSLLSNETLFITHGDLNCCYEESMEDCRGLVEEPNDSVEVKWDEFYEDAKTCWSGDCGTQIITFDETWKRRVREVQERVLILNCRQIDRNWCYQLSLFSLAFCQIINLKDHKYVMRIKNMEETKINLKANLKLKTREQSFPPQPSSSSLAPLDWSAWCWALSLHSQSPQSSLLLVCLYFSQLRICPRLAGRFRS